MEIWDILDENGNKTGKIIQKGEEFPKGFYHQSADVWIINSENKILIQKRAPQKKLSPNVWAMTGGSVIRGETSLQTIERETEEEMAVKLDIDKAQLVARFKTGIVWVDTYLIRQDINLDDIIMQKDEVAEVKWATYEKIEELFKNGQFIEGRWNFVRGIFKKIL
ncbi:MAG: NUDIX domain-containing protein [Clostridia bacterium]|jgi:isopentenyldiphosphate isomerase|nr:NUDIX domain-containing protein [Clostridia bacterium]